jgi:hypothetical protein
LGYVLSRLGERVNALREVIEASSMLARAATTYGR